MRTVLRWLRRIMVGFVIGSITAVAVFRFVDPPVTPLMLIRAVEDVARGDRPSMRAHWVDLDAVSPLLLRSVIAAEDARFFEHKGIDLAAIEEAREYNQRHRGRRRRGASTITMQTARNVFLWPGRTWVRKGFEIYFAVLMEALWGKRRILETYVNVIEWGPGIYGAEAASQAFFGIPASDLDARRAALLAVALPNPRRWNPAAPTAYLSSRAATIARRARAVDLGSIRGTPSNRLSAIMRLP